MSPPKPLVLVVTSTLPRWQDDTEPRFVLDLCLALASRYRIIVLAPHCRGAAMQERIGDVEILRFRYFAEGGERLAYDGGMLPKLRRQPWLWALVPFFMAALVVAIARILRREPVAVVHAHWLVPQGLAARVARLLAFRPVPLVCTAHGADVFGLRGAFARALQRWVGAGCARVGAVSEALADELVRRGIARERIRLLPMGIDVPQPAPPASQRDPRLIAFAGRLVEKKGVGVLLQAFSQLRTRVPGLRLCIAGGGPELERHRREAAALGVDAATSFLGPVSHDQVQDLFSRAAVAVMPSLTAADGDAEGLGLVMIEAMAARCPVITSDLPVVRGVIRPEETGLTFPERDAPALAAALERVLADAALAARLGDRGRREVEGRFSWQAVAASHAAAYGDATAAP